MKIKQQEQPNMKLSKLQFIMRSLISLMIFSSMLIGINAQTAKPADPPKRKVIVTSEYFIKPGMMAEYLNLIRNEGRAIYLKAGEKRSEVYTRVYGESASAIVMEYYDSFEDMVKSRAEFSKNGGEALQLFTMKAQQFLERSAKVVIMRNLPEGTWVNPQMTYKPTKYYVITHRWIAPFRMRDYLNYLQNDYMPLVQKSELTAQIASAISYNDEPQTFVATPIPDLAELDKPNPVTKVISSDDLFKLQQQKLTGVVTRTESFILRFWEDLSISTKQSQEAAKK
jgi:hypothetical protein